MAYIPDGTCSPQVITAARKVHRQLGPGLLESAYEACLAHELRLMGHRVDRQVPLTLEYEGLRLDCVYRLDLLVDDAVIVELKTVMKLLPVHEMQLLSYLRIAHKPVGLLMNFNEPRLMDGVRRKLNDRPLRR